MGGIVIVRAVTASASEFPPEPGALREPSNRCPVAVGCSDVPNMECFSDFALVFAIIICVLYSCVVL